MGDANPADPTVLPGFGQDQPDHVRFPNTRLRNSRSASISTWTTTSGGHSHTHSQPNNNPREPEQCRICRGEATPDDPLYHPCKCSGSIKWVHQECLMQWLAQTQRKHCELCKTPFRFTKLYDPDMPRTVPAHIFIGHMFKYSVRKLLVWARAALVVSVWLGWLPYFMRSVWAMLFWLCEEGWGGPALFSRSQNISSNGFSVTAYSTTVCPSSPLFLANTSPASVGDVLGRLPLNSTQFVNSLTGANSGAGYSFLSVLLRIIFGSGGIVDRTPPPLKEIPSHLSNNVTATLFIDQTASPYSNVSYPPSLLSEVGFLKNLTRNPTVNNNIIAVLEGQIITVLVVVCFILIILVRDYVVQQQPEINERAAFANLQNVQPQVAQVNVPDPAMNGNHNGGHNGDHNGDHLGGIEEEEDAGTDDEHAWHAQPPQPGPQPDRNPVNNPYASDLERELGESDSSTIDEYLNIYREAGGNPDRIVELAQERGLEERLAYWIALTKTMKERAARVQANYNDGLNPSAAESSTTAAARPSGHNLEMDSTPAAPRPDPFDDWRYPLEEDDHQAEETGQGSRDKGKGVATDDFDTESDPEIIGASSRPRANTDGPEIRMHTNPLGSNSWSFNDLPEDGPNSPSTEERPSQVISTAPDLNTDNYSSNTEVEPLLASLAGQGESESFQENRSQDGNRDIADDVRVHTEPWGANPIPERQSESQELTDIPWPTLDESTADSPAQPPQPRGFVPRVTDFMWQGVEADQAQHDAIDIIADALMRRDDQDNVDVRDDARLDNDDDLDQDDDDAAAAIGLEQDAIDDAEDLEGVLELLGMRGPLAGLFQNAIFCVLLVSATIFLGLFVPYNIGRYSLWFIAKPMRPVWILYSLCRFIQDMVVIAFGLVSHALSLVHPSLGLGGVARLVTKLLFGSRYATATLDPHIEMTNAAKRVGHTVIHELGRVSMSEIHTFSAVSHEALLSVKGQIFSGFAALGSALVFIFGGDYSTKAPLVFSAASSATALALNALKTLPATLLKPNLVINVNFPDASHAIDPALAYWNGTDRFWAILAGYLTIYIAAVLYLRRGGPISSSQTGQEWEAAIIDALNQASGVMKVILIIGIEMLVFPLYCGMLLDIALLPLFENATLMSRLQFTLNFPVTSIFVHWFVGTAYMFHFALFVSMCRKIMRRGVLYFIRDPDDPEFHPVRDVLERNVTTQLRKIAFSALVYGALVIICLGAVVWGLALSLPNVLPIHYSSNEPVLEFPLDLLFYNFLMPLAVKFFKPGDGLHAMYTWWFRTCGRCLRITWFLFGERKADEEGRLRMIERGPGSQESWWQAMFLQLDESNGLVRPWKPKFVAESTKAEASESEPESPNIRGYVPSESEARESEARERSPEEGFKDYLVDTKQLIPDGRFVRAPASDQVKIPKGKTVFLEVSEKNERLDGKPDVPETDLYSTTQYRLVYVPPHFRVRIFFFILLIWMFAAATGVGITIIPLVFGRWMFQLLIPEGVRTNDIYAFGIGIHVLGSIVYALINIRSLSQTAKIRVAGAIVSVFNNGAVRRGLAVITRIAKIVYSYFFLLVVFPLMIASVAELYFMMPLHEFMYSVPIAQDIKQVTIEHAAALNPRHTIRVMQSWTIGLLYLKLSVRGITTWFSGSRLALATKAVLRRGWFNPNAGVLTRAFVIPAILLWTVAMAIPTLFAKFMISWSLAETLTLRHPQAVVDGVVDQTFYDAYVVLIYRRSFPLTALLLLAVAAVWGLLGVFQSWKMRIRDEAYLIGERLQNYGGGMPQRGLGRGTRGGWRAGIAVGGR